LARWSLYFQRPQALPDPVAGRSRKAGIHVIKPAGESSPALPWLSLAFSKEMPLKRIQIDFPGLQEDFRKLGLGLMLASSIGALLQNGGFTNALFTLAIGFALWAIGIIRIMEVKP